MKNRLDDMSRTERYFTATLLPILLFHNGFNGLKMFLRMMRMPKKGILDKEFDIDNEVLNDEVQIITEFQPKRDAVYYDYHGLIDRNEIEEARGRSADCVIVTKTHVFIIEGKLFTHYQDTEKLKEQIEHQEKDFRLLSYLPEYSSLVFKHILLTDEQTVRKVEEDFKGKKMGFGIISWNEINELYASDKELKNHYVMKRLSEAIERKKVDVRSTINKNDVKYEEGLSFDEICRIADKRDYVFIGFHKGIIKLKDKDTDEKYLRSRNYRYVVGKGKNAKEWIDGKVFLEEIKKKGLI